MEGKSHQPSQDNQNTAESRRGFIQGAPHQPWTFSTQNIPSPSMTPGIMRPHHPQAPVRPAMPPNVGMSPQHRPHSDGYYPSRDPRQQHYPTPFQPQGRPPLAFNQPAFQGQQQHSFPYSPLVMRQPPPPQWGIPPPPLSLIPNMPRPPPGMPPFFSPTSIPPPPIIRPLHFGPQGTPPWTPKGGTKIIFPPAPAPRGTAQRMGMSDDSVTMEMSVRVSHGDPFIADWLRIVGSKREHQRQQEEMERGSQQQRIKIVEVRQLLSRASVLLTLLSSAHQQLCALSGDDIIQWREITSQVNVYKDELCAIRRRLESGGDLEQLVRKVDKRKKRRVSMKLRLREMKALRVEKRAKAEEATEKWLTEKRQAELKAKTEKSVQIAASGVLNEVKQKQSELQKYLKLVPALQKLRDFRKEALKRKGESPSIEDDERFTESCDSLQNLLTRQSRVYEDEERALRVLMEEEVEEKMSSQRRRDESRAQNEFHTTTSVEPIINPPHQASATDLIMEPFTQYYLQAEQNEDCLAAVRSQWDHFLSPLGVPISCNLDNPTLPVPSANEWSQYILHPVQ